MHLVIKGVKIIFKTGIFFSLCGGDQLLMAELSAKDKWCAKEHRVELKEKLLFLFYFQNYISFMNNKFRETFVFILFYFIKFSKLHLFHE